ncbi:hypothetical protein [Nocardia jinanensis]|nr:hypothetical protein [Nocardia jinanensis]
MSNWSPTGSPHAAPGATWAFPGDSGVTRGRVRTAALVVSPGAAR